MITLVISDGEGTTTSVPLVLDDVSIGRKEGNTIRLTERNISREHCRIQRVNGDYVVRDLESYNGVLINGRRIDKEATLKAGDEIRIGDYTVHFKSDSAPVSKPPSVPVPPPTAGAAELDDRAEQEPTTVAPLPKAPPRIVVLTSSLAGAEFVLPENGEVRIGRGPELEACIDHRSVSREHAKVVMQGGRARIVDRESANGVVVNHEKVSEASLAAGDIIELGDVVVRYVAAGESFTFDPDEARAVLAAHRPRARSQWLLAGAILVAALVGATFILSTSEPDGQVTATEPSAMQPVAAVVEPSLAAVPAASDAERLATLLGACREAVEGGRFAEAIAHANAALKLRPDAPDALACQQTARDNHDQEQMYVRAEAALESGDVESAWSELLGLSQAGAVAKRPEVQKTIESVAARVIERASDLSRRDSEQGAALARSVADREGLSEDLRDRGRKLLARSEAQRSEAPRPAASRAARAPEPTPRAAPAPRTRSSASGSSPMDTASACLARGDNACVVKALAGRAQTAQELGLLIETYRALGDAAAAQRNMALYVQRFPAARRAEAYRQQLSR